MRVSLPFRRVSAAPTARHSLCHFFIRWRAPFRSRCFSFSASLHAADENAAALIAVVELIVEAVAVVGVVLFVFFLMLVRQCPRGCDSASASYLHCPRG